MSVAIVTGLSVIIAVLIGALVQPFVNSLAIKKSRNLELKTKAYSDFMEAAARLSIATNPNYVVSPEEHLRTVMRFIAAKNHLCVFGDASVINKAVELEKTSKKLNDSNAQKAYIALGQEMRRHGISHGDIDDSVIGILLFGP